MQEKAVTWEKYRRFLLISDFNMITHFDHEARSSHSSGVFLPILFSNLLSTGLSARVIFDQKCNIVWANEAFGKMRSEGQLFQSRPGLLCFAVKKHQSSVDLFVSDESADDGFFWAEINETGVKFAVQLRRIRSSMIEDHFAIRIVDGDIFLSDNFRHVQSHFGMTKQEYHICKLLLCGRTVQDIVALDGKSPDTVRFHIKNIYRRMGVSSREEMFAGLMHFLFD